MYHRIIEIHDLYKILYVERIGFWKHWFEELLLDLKMYNEEAKDKNGNFSEELVKKTIEDSFENNSIFSCGFIAKPPYTKAKGDELIRMEKLEIYNEVYENYIQVKSMFISLKNLMSECISLELGYQFGINELGDDNVNKYFGEARKIYSRIIDSENEMEILFSEFKVIHNPNNEKIFIETETKNKPGRKRKKQEAIIEKQEQAYLFKLLSKVKAIEPITNNSIAILLNEITGINTKYANENVLPNKPTTLQKKNIMKVLEEAIKLLESKDNSIWE